MEGLPDLPLPASGKHGGQPASVHHIKHDLVVYYTDQSEFCVRKGSFAYPPPPRPP
jgi:hypothetical protein